MNLFDYMNENSFTGFLFFIAIIPTISWHIIIIFNKINDLVTKFIRMVNIIMRGWPPSHLDADGDFQTIEEEDDEEKN